VEIKVLEILFSIPFARGCSNLQEEVPLKRGHTAGRKGEAKRADREQSNMSSLEAECTAWMALAG
jgi:hypothetical protein